MQAVRTVDPTREPVEVEAFKSNTSYFEDLADKDAFISDNLVAAREHVENITRRAILTQTWVYYLNAFPDVDYIKLPFGNLQSVTSIKYTNSSGTQTTMTVTTEYLVETNGPEIGRIVLPYGVSWPSYTLYPSKPIAITYVCGWLAPQDVPRIIRKAVEMIAADLCENIEGQIATSNMATTGYADNPMLKRLLMSHILWDEF